MRTARILFALLLGCLLTIGCGGGGGGGTGTLALHLTDGPFPDMSCLAAADVTVDLVEVQSDTGWIEIPLASPPPVTFHLLDLQNGLTTELAVGSLPTGTYHQIRLHLVDAMLTFADASTKSFTVPSGMQTGIKINVNPQFVIAAGQTTGVVLDFSLAESFHVTGTGGDPTCEDLKSETTMFNPVIRAVDTDTSGVLAGVVTYNDQTAAALIEVRVTLSGGDPTTESQGSTLSANGTLANAPLGSYALRLVPDTYDVYVPGDADMDGDGFDLAAAGVVIVSQQITTQDIELATAPPAP